VTPDAASRARHPSSGRPTLPPPGGSAGQLRRQRRHTLAAASAVTLALIVLAAVNPTAGIWLAKGVLTYLVACGLWIAAREWAWWRMRRRMRRFDQHTTEALRVVR
jgi:hypothetical protein